MKSILFVIPLGNGLPVFGYGLFLMLGFLVGLLLACRRAKRAGLPPNSAMDVGLISIVAGVLGARAAFLLLDYHPAEGVGSPIEWLAVWQGGLTFQGGLLLALLADYAYLRRKNISAGKMFDVYAPSLALGVGFGRIGCLLNGCCWGALAPAGSFFGMYFPEENEAMASQYWLYETNPEGWAALMRSLGYPPDTTPIIPVYATQIVSAIGLFLIAAGLIWAERRWRKRQDGQVIVWFLFAYGVGRFIIEFWRDDTPLRYGVGLFPGLRLGQWLGLAMIAAGVIWQMVLNKRARNASGNAPSA